MSESRSLIPLLAVIASVAHGQPAVTVPDLIGMATFGSQNEAGYIPDSYDVRSPDGRHVAAIVHRGNLVRNTVDYALIVFKTANLIDAPRADTAARFASSSNRPGIARVRWRDNATVLVLGEQPRALPQVYAVDILTHHVKPVTHARTAIQEFDVAANGQVLVYAAEEPVDTSAYVRMRAHGFVVARSASVVDLVAGHFGARSPEAASLPRSLTFVQRDRERRVALPDSAAGYSLCYLPGGLSISPTGDVAIVVCFPVRNPSSWASYRLPDFDTAPGARYFMSVVVDLRTGAFHALTEAPESGPFAWTPDGRAVVLADAMLPLTGADSAERQAWATHRFPARIDVRTGTVTILDSATTRPDANPRLIVTAGMNEPPRLVAVDARTGRRSVVYDPNPGLLAARKFGHEETVHWKSKAGQPWVGGLYRPPDARPGIRYPLVIQTHDFDSTRFMPTGIFSTGEAAQPLGGVGIVVLQMGELPDDVNRVPDEGRLTMEGMEGAIDYLDSLGLIDRRRVGIQGFSRTVYHTLYFLTHSSYPIAAATITDGIDMSYVQRTMLGSDSAFLAEYDDFNEGRPEGASLEKWLERAPGFNLDRVTAAVLVTAAEGTSGLFEMWEAYARLLQDGKPTELVYIPDGAHEIVKPWELVTSQQGAVDWYRFWLKGEEDPDARKAPQYRRWRALRATAAGAASPRS